MTMKVNKETYRQLIDEDIAWLRKYPRTLERGHIIDVLEWSIDQLYPAIDYEERIKWFIGQPIDEALKCQLQVLIEEIKNHDATCRTELYARYRDSLNAIQYLIYKQLGK